MTFPVQKQKGTSTKADDLVKTTSGCTDAMTVFCAFFPSVYDQCKIDLRSVCINVSDGFHAVSIQKNLEHVLCIYTWCLYGVFFDGVSTQVPWKIDVGFMEVSCRFLCSLCRNVMVAWFLLIDAVFMEVPCKFHGKLMWVSCSFHVRFESIFSIYTCWFYHAL